MDFRKKIALNTIVLYIKLIAKIFLVMLSTRIVLQYMGVEDFGLYNLIAGIIALLSFLNGAMMSSTQRFLSVEMGTGSFQHLRTTFASSVAIHIIMGIIISVLLLSLMPILFSDILSIPQEKLEVAAKCYIIMILNILITLIAIPFNAAINSHEDIWYFALIEIVCEFSKLCSAYSLYYIMSDKLVAYSLLILSTTILGALAKIIWSYIKYKEITINIFKYSTKKCFNRIFKFVSWYSLAVFANILRSQGVAVVLNMFFGVIVNAAYAITNQVNSALTSFAQITTSSLDPQIMKSKGENNLERMRFLAVLASKLAFLLASIFALFLLIDLPLVLQTWLIKFPTETVTFCNYTIWTFLVMELYPGLVRMIQANGNIRNYSIITSLLAFLILPIGYMAFCFGHSPASIVQIMLVSQILTLLSSLFFAKKQCGLDVQCYLTRNIIVPVLIFIVLLSISQIWYENISHSISHLIFVGICSNVVYIIAFYVFVFNVKEKESALALVNSYIKKH